MHWDTYFWVALHSSFLLGLVHGVNPCGHSWLMLAPFVVGKTSGKRALVLTGAFLSGTALACVCIGILLGALSMALPSNAATAVGVLTGGIVVLLGVILVIKPGLLHSHDHNHEHEHEHETEHTHEHVHSHEQEPQPKGKLGRFIKISALGLFSIGFVNMIVPCPTLAVMYSYGLNSENWMKSLLVFSVYAASTAVAVGGMIFLLRRTAHLILRMDKPWLETSIVRVAGLLTIAFGAYSIYEDLGFI